MKMNAYCSARQNLWSFQVMPYLMKSHALNSNLFRSALDTKVFRVILWRSFRPQSLEAHPLQPQLTHCRSWSSFSCARGTRHTHVARKLVSFVWTHRKQHNCHNYC